MDKPRLATGSDVARLAGVSKSAVSRAYNGGYVAPDARQRILEAARKLRYRPNPAARALSTNRSRLIGLSITALDNQFYPELVDQLSDALGLAGLRLVLFTTRGQAELEPMLDELLAYHLDGVILASTSYATRVAVECADAGIPVIMLNNVDPNERIAGVSTDNRAGSEAIAAHFVECGYQRVAVINGLEESSASVERTRHFRDYLLERRLAPPRIVSGRYTFEGASAATRALLDHPDRLDAIYCTTDLMALACLQTARTLGVVPGRDVGIAGFDDAPVAAWPAFSLTTYATPLAALIDACVSRLISAIEGHPLDASTIRLPGALVVRGSTASKPRG